MTCKPFTKAQIAAIKKRRATWTAALRSGKYKQTTGRLYSPCDGGYCCLGVAAKVCHLPVADLVYGEGLYRGDRERLGITTAQHDRLVNLNDMYRHSFKRIASVIDKMPIKRDIYI